MIAFPRRAEVQYNDIINESSDSMLGNAYLIKRLPVSKRTKKKINESNVCTQRWTFINNREPDFYATIKFASTRIGCLNPMNEHCWARVIRYRV